jgi:TRAP-type mannitol/chloroaromatic compound transport system permease small subunit
MSEETSSEHNYKFAYSVCAIFLIGFVLVTLAVVSDAFHRTELEQVVPETIAAPSPTPSPGP